MTLRSSNCLVPVLLCSLLWGTAVWAEGPRILVISDPNVPSELEQSTIRTLSSVGSVINPVQYMDAARKQRLPPYSEKALSQLGPKAQARLIVALSTSRSKVQITYRDGSTGAIIAKQKLTASRRKPELSDSASRKLSATARKALSRAGSQPIAVEDDDDDSEPERPAAAVSPSVAPAHSSAGMGPVASRPVASRPAAVSAAASTAASEALDEPEHSSASEREAEETPASKPDAGDPLIVRISAGTGLGGRALDIPRSRVVARELDTGLSFPALEIGVSGQLPIDPQWLIGAEVVYRGLPVLTQRQEGGLRPVSNHSVVFGVAPGYRFEGPGGMEMRLFVGWTLRWLQPERDALPSSNISGPVLRPELRIPIGDGWLTLRIAPELIYVISVDATFRGGTVTRIAESGIGIGGEASVDLRLVHPVYLGVAYRESDVFVSSAWDTSFYDAERYLIGRLSLVF